MEENFLVEPQQARSQETLRNILDAAAHILDRKTFEELTVAEVVAEAGTSVGAFYGRFKDKDALLQALDERFFDEFGKEVEVLLVSLKVKGKPLAVIVYEICAFVVDAYSRQKGVLRSLNLKGRLSYDVRFLEREKYAWDTFFPGLIHIFLGFKDQIRHPEPNLAIRLGFRQLFYTMREIVLWQPLPGEPIYENEVLVRELTRSYLSYLGIEQYE
jgi:AcrR family transcriptional regulator